MKCKLTDDQVAWAYQKNCEGHSLTQIAAALHVHDNTITREFKRRGILKPVQIPLVYDPTEPTEYPPVPETKPMTNADRIRSMTDDELNDFIQTVMDAENNGFYCLNKKECNDMLDGGELVPDVLCADCLRAWLQQPSKSEKG